MIGGERATGTLVGGLGARDGLSLEGGKALTYGHGADAARAARVGGKAAVHGSHVVRASHGPVAVSRVVNIANQRGQALGLDDQRGGGAGLVGKPERAGGAALAYEGAGLVTEYKPVQGRRLGEARRDPPTRDRRRRSWAPPASGRVGNGLQNSHQDKNDLNALGGARAACCGLPTEYLENPVHGVWTSLLGSSWAKARERLVR